MKRRKRQCEECHQYKGTLPFLFDYHDEDMNVIEERRTCYECWQKLCRTKRVIAHGPMTKRSKDKYHSVHVVGEANKYQMELFK